MALPYLEKDDFKGNPYSLNPEPTLNPPLMQIASAKLKNEMIRFANTQALLLKTQLERFSRVSYSP